MQAWRRRSLATDPQPGENALIREQLEITSQQRNLTEIYGSLDRFEAAAMALRGNEVGAVYDAFKTAVVEIATNILRHAYPLGASPAPLTLHLYLFPHQLEALFYDQGVAFSPPTELTPPAIDDVMELPEGNLGLFLALQALDHLDYSRTPAGVNQWRLIKHLP